MEITLLWILAGLQLKHFLGDYTLQWPAMIRDKCHLNRAGGYIHSGIHIFGTLLVLAAAGIGWAIIWKILVLEFVIHFFTDFAKARYSAANLHKIDSASFWVAHGFDQLIHQLTYLAIIAAIAFRLVS